MIGRCNDVWQEYAGIDLPGWGRRVCVWVCVHTYGGAILLYYGEATNMSADIIAKEWAKDDRVEWFLKKKRWMKKYIPVLKSSSEVKKQKA